MFKITGKTTDGKIVVKGVYKMYETDGLPLDVIFGFLNENNAIPDWLWFFIEATEAGMKPERILSKLEHPIADSYGPEMRDVVIKKLRCFYTLHDKRMKIREEALDKLAKLGQEFDADDGKQSPDS